MTLEWFMHRADRRVADLEPIRASSLVVTTRMPGAIAVDRIGLYVQARAPQPLIFGVLESSS